MAPVKRFWEVDSFRGIAIILMLVSNFVTDVAFFGVYSIDIYSGFWPLFARVVVSMFLLLVGASLTLSYSRVGGRPLREVHRKYFLRGLKIFSWGMLITALTLVFLKQGFIWFGVLHLIGIGIILAHFLLRYRFLNLFCGILIVLIGIYLQTLAFDFSFMLWLGMRPVGFFSVDYVPIFPWFGMILIGMFLGNTLYPKGKRCFTLPDSSRNPLVRALSFLGRNSLLIYLVHQPVIIVLFWLLFPFPYNFAF
jgi:uncharacterized membrane protein